MQPIGEKRSPLPRACGRAPWMNLSGRNTSLDPINLLRRILEADRLSSVIFYGPPGTGKTALAHVIANHTRCRFRQVNAVATGVKEVRQPLAEARAELEDSGRRTILFVDEIHRFNRAQQDVLLPEVEEGIVILIGATTQNPFFAINSPLVSRSQIFTFEPLTRDQIKTLLEWSAGRRLARTGKDGNPRRRGRARLPGRDERRRRTAGTERSGDRRPSAGGTPVEFTLEVAQDSIQRKWLDYDATGDAHYDITSAFMKSMRGSDPDAAVYWLARMLEAGEDPRFIARRIIICELPEDVGNATPKPFWLPRPAPSVSRIRRAARMSAAVGPSGHLHRNRAQIECSDGGDCQSPRGRSRGKDASGARALARRQLPGSPTARGTASATSTRTTLPAAGSINRTCPRSGRTTNQWIEGTRWKSADGWRNGEKIEMAAATAFATAGDARNYTRMNSRFR